MWRASKAIAPIQILRGIAAVGVAFAHSPHAQLLSSYTKYGAVGVDLFFVISGFIMVHSSAQLFGSSEGARIFLIRRISRIVPLYWIITFAQIWLIVHLGQSTTLASVLSSLFFVPYGNGIPLVGVGWTLNFEMFFYLVFAMAVVCSRELAIFLAALLLALCVALGKLDFAGPFRLLFQPIILEFALGLALGLLYARGYRAPGLLRAGLILSGVVLWLVSAKTGFYATPTSDPGRFLAWGFPAALIVAGAAFSRHPDGEGRLYRLGCQVGDASYAIYLMHPILGLIIHRRIWNFVASSAAATLGLTGFPFDLDLLNHIAAWGETIVGLMVIVIASLAMFYVFEKPANSFIQRKLTYFIRAGAGSGRLLGRRQTG